MPSQTWTLTDVACDIHKNDFRISADDIPGMEGSWSVTQRTLQSGLSEGVDIVEIDNGQMRLVVIPTRGMGIWKARIGDETLGWRSPVRGPVHPKFVPLFDPSGLGWLEGFDELVVRCGLESNGAPEFDEQGHLRYPLHGRIANRPAYQVEVTVDDEAGAITLSGKIEETRFHFQKLRLTASVTTAFDSTSFTINDKVENFGGSPAEMQMLYHINLGEPFLEPGATILAPATEVKPSDAAATENFGTWNRLGPPVANQPEQCFSLELAGDATGQTQVLLKNAAGNAGAAIGFPTNQLPCFTIWKNMSASADGYVTGLEPATNFPNQRSLEAEQGRVIRLPAGETWAAEVVVDWLTSAEEVLSVEAAIENLRPNS